ncbi:hypothetical protein QBC43DRAFT_362598 [Cladorrhinum sp. PSN259]|nr:hypothetical protein QBC43DRAFT_362598 [Cladorrhinum sp. PSN259]
MTLNADKKFAACCCPSTRLLGSATTAFDCCAAGHDLAGGTSSLPPTLRPAILFAPRVTSKCVCLTGTTEVGGRCMTAAPSNSTAPVAPRQSTPSPTSSATSSATPSAESRSGGDVCYGPQCSSGVTAGKCFLFNMNFGGYLGFDALAGRKYYSASTKISRNHNVGKFRLCRDEKCTDTTTEINPGEPFHIMDLHGEANSGLNPNQWLNNVHNGGHIGRTSNYAQAGVFTITKWTDGKYCLSGFTIGVGPTCPNEEPAVTFNTLDTRSCMPLTLEPVPCDVRDVTNNCLWANNNKPCPASHACVPSLSKDALAPVFGAVNQYRVF